MQKGNEEKLFNIDAVGDNPVASALPVNNTKKDGLTEQQDLFCFWAACLFNFAEAYRRAYNVEKSTKPNTIYQAVNDLKKNPKITLRVKYYRRVVLSKNILTAQEILQNLTEIALKYRVDDKHLPQSLRALENLGEYRGVLKNKNDCGLNFADATINFNTNFDTYKKDTDLYKNTNHQQGRKEDTHSKEKTEQEHEGNFNIKGANRADFNGVDGIGGDNDAS